MYNWRDHITRELSGKYSHCKTTLIKLKEICNNNGNDTNHCALHTAKAQNKHGDKFIHATGTTVHFVVPRNWTELMGDSVDMELFLFF